MKKTLIMSLFLVCPLLASNNNNLLLEKESEDSKIQIINILSNSSVEKLETISNTVAKLTYTPLTPEKLLEKFKKNTGHDSRFYPIKGLDVIFDRINVRKEFKALFSMGRFVYVPKSHFEISQNYYVLVNFLEKNGMGDSTLKAQHNLAVFLLDGCAISNVKKAKTLLLKCAIRGLVKSRYLLGTDERFNNDEKINQAMWFLEASEDGYPPALATLAEQYETKDDEKYTSYLKKAAEAGFYFRCWAINEIFEKEKYPKISDQIDWIKAYQNQARYVNSQAFEKLSKYYFEKDTNLAERYKLAHESAQKFEEVVRFNKNKEF